MPGEREEATAGDEGATYGATEVGGRDKKMGERGPPSAVSCRSSGDHAKREKVPNRT